MMDFLKRLFKTKIPPTSIVGKVGTDTPITAPLSFMDISPAKAYTMMQDGVLTLIDVREPAEWAQTGRPQGSIGISLKNLAMITECLEAAGNRSAPVALSCMAGARSEQAAESLIKAGFQEVYSVTGGIKAWIEAGLPLDQPPFDNH